MLTRDDLLTALNNSNLAANMSTLQKLLLKSASEMILNRVASPSAITGDTERKRRVNEDRMILNMVGPAAASAAVEYAVNQCRRTDPQFHGRVSGKLNGSYIHNANIVHNDDAEFPQFSNILRQFLLPRYAYIDFDIVVDPRHQVDLQCGYPRYITPIMYRYMYDRDDVARRVVDAYPNESWAVDPEVYETDDETKNTEFELTWQNLCESYNIMPYLYRLDKMAGIGHYGVMLLGVDDGNDLEKPIEEPELLAGFKRSVSRQRRQMLYMRPFDEYLSFIHQYETDVLNPRYGLPKFYNLVFLDMTIDAAGASIGTRLNRRVHWSRVVHTADNLMSSLVFGIPRQQPVFNRLLDLRKLKGASAEMFWNGGFPGISFEVDPKFVADNPSFDPEELRQQVRDYFEGLERGIFTQGVVAKTLAPSICEHPDSFVNVHLHAIAGSLEMPLRVFTGSEEGKLSSSQDIKTWNKRLDRRQRMFVTPYIIRNFIDRLIAIGILPAPQSGKYFVKWPDLDAPTDEDKASLALKWSQALSQYVASGMIHLIEPMDYLTMILGLSASNAKKIVDNANANGGFAKLLKVDPSQGAGVNGKRENIADKTSADDKPKRDTDDKKVEGVGS